MTQTNCIQTHSHSNTFHTNEFSKCPLSLSFTRPHTPTKYILCFFFYFYFFILHSTDSIDVSNSSSISKSHIKQSAFLLFIRESVHGYRISCVCVYHVYRVRVFFWAFCLDWIRFSRSTSWYWHRLMNGSSSRIVWNSLGFGFFFSLFDFPLLIQLQW